MDVQSIHTTSYVLSIHITAQHKFKLLKKYLAMYGIYY